MAGSRMATVPLTLATFNVKDLFDPAFDAKLTELATQLARADADVVALQEIASEHALIRLLAKVPRGHDYAHVLLALPDKRGIRNAIVSRLPFVTKEVHTAQEIPFPVFREGDAAPFPKRIPLRRGVPHVCIDVAGLGAVEIMTAHFKSKLPAHLVRPDGTTREPTTEAARAESLVRSLVLRAAEALYVRGLVDDALARTPNVALLGDLNDTIDSVPLQIVLGAAEGALFACAEIIPREARFSTLHAGRKRQIDHVLVSAELRDRLLGAELFNESLQDHGPLVPGAAPTADSDHALLVTRFDTSRPSRDSIANTQRSA